MVAIALKSPCGKFILPLSPSLIFFEVIPASGISASVSPIILASSEPLMKVEVNNISNNLLVIYISLY